MKNLLEHNLNPKMIAAPGIPRPISAAYNSSSMMAAINWVAPEQYNGNLLGYAMSITPRESVGINYHVNFSASTSSYSFDIPILCRTYTVALSAYTTVGFGNATYTQFIASAPGELQLHTIFYFLSIAVLWRSSTHTGPCGCGCKQISCGWRKWKASKTKSLESESGLRFKQALRKTKILILSNYVHKY